jgi:murein DD-endopeptidase MepM/ murein hydrolase activator NlpD
MARHRRSSGAGVLLAVVAAVVAAHHYSTTSAQSAPSAVGGYAKPVAGVPSSEFGRRAGGMHYGFDIAAPRGTPIRAVAAGTVIEAGPIGGFGLWVRLRHPDGTVTVYGHMHTIDRPRGDVAAGERIATVGSRGQSTGPHLHLEVWPRGDRSARIDPRPWLAARGIHY